MLKSFIIFALVPALSVCSLSAYAQFGELEKALKSLAEEQTTDDNKVDRFADTTCRDMIGWVEDNKKRNKRKKRLNNHKNCDAAFNLIKQETPNALKERDWGKFKPILIAAVETIEKQEMDRTIALNKPKEGGTFLLCEKLRQVKSSYGDGQFPEHDVTTAIYLDTATIQDVSGSQLAQDSSPIDAKIRICAIDVHHNTEKYMVNSQARFASYEEDNAPMRWDRNPIDEFLGKAESGCGPSPADDYQSDKVGIRNTDFYYMVIPGLQFSDTRLALNRETLRLSGYAPGFATEESPFDSACSVTDASSLRDHWTKIYTNQRATNERVKRQQSQAEKLKNKI